MQTIEKEIPKFELCKKLKELGYPQDDGLFYWLLLPTWDEPELVYAYGSFGQEINNLPAFKFKAPMVQELSEWLPSNAGNLELHIAGGYYGWKISYENDNWIDFDLFVGGRKLADALAQILIKLHEKGYVDFVYRATKQILIDAIIDVYEQHYYMSGGFRQKNLATYRKELEQMSKKELFRELVEAIQDTLYYEPEKNFFDTMGLSAYANAVKVLARDGFFKIESDGGRRIIGRLTDKVEELYV